jgi:membrane fusion protein, multidrug efflux system
VELLKTASVSDQETAEKTSDLALKKAALEAADANLQRLKQLKIFDGVTAPFDGTITLRNTDIGQLISANSGPELFRLAQVNPLRVYVQVPQPLIHAITPGQTAQLAFQELPGRTFEAKVTRTAGAVDPASRTLQVELQVDNSRGEILAGSYAQARFSETVPAVPVLVLSDNALIFRAQGMQIATVDSDNKVQLHSVKLGRDFGNTVEVLSGLNADDRVIINPPDSIADGETVEITPLSDTNSPGK